MKTIVMLDTDDQEKINKFQELWNKDPTVFISCCEEVKVFIVDANGKVTKLK